MCCPAAILHFGGDAQLLQLRSRVLAGAGFEVDSVDTFPALQEALQGGRFDLVLVCHSLSRTDCETALRLIAGEAPCATVVILGSGPCSCPVAPGAVEIDALRGPAELIAAVRALVEEKHPSRFTQGERHGPIRWTGTLVQQC